MKIYFYIIALLIISVCGANASAQQRIYLETDRLFEKSAVIKLDNANKSTLEDYGQRVENKVSLDNKPEREAASLLADLQENPDAAVASQTGSANAMERQKSLRADIFIIEYLKVLTDYSQLEGDDPLKTAINRLANNEGRVLLTTDLSAKLGTGAEREEKFAALATQIKVEFSAENLPAIKASLASSTAKKPYPLCVIFPPC